MSTQRSSREPQPITLQSRVPNDAHGLDLLAYLCRRFPYLTRAAWQAELADGRIQLDSTIATGGERLRRGMRLRYQKLHKEPQVSLD